MQEVQIFKNDLFGEVRALNIDNEPWFVGKDVAEILGYKDTSDAMKRHVDEDDKGVGEIPTPGGKQNMKVINESGLYSLILSSKLPNAKQFKSWVTREVLPTIRKHGAYMTDEILDKTLSNPDFMIGLLQNLKEEQEKRRQAELQVQHKQEVIDVIVKQNITFNEFNKQIRTIINRICSVKKITQAEAFIKFYKYVNVKMSINIMSRVTHKKNELDKIYYSKTKKHYKESTLNTKVTVLSVIKEEEYAQVLKIARCWATSCGVDVVDINKLK